MLEPTKETIESTEREEKESCKDTDYFLFNGVCFIRETADYDEFEDEELS